MAEFAFHSDFFRSPFSMKHDRAIVGWQFGGW
jgi:hypothetical protein